MNSGVSVSAGAIKVVLALLGVALFVAGLWFGVQKLRSWGNDQVDGAATRPYPAPNRLVVAAVPKDYASFARDDGALFLPKLPRGPAVGLAGFYGSDPARATGAVEKALSAMPGATYRALPAPTEKCRSDAETSTTTLGEITVSGHTITLFTCVLTKKKNVYFLAWACDAADVDKEQTRIVTMIKSSQLVSNDLCAMNVINGGCSAAVGPLVTALVDNVRK